MGEKKTTAQVLIRPLHMSSFPLLPFQSRDEPIDPSSLLKDLCNDRSDGFLEKMRERYERLSTQELEMFAVPAEKKILEKLVWPLRTAKQDFILGHYVACISLCGMVCEMATIFVFDLAKATIGSKGLDASRQKRLFGREFEKLGQQRRLDILADLGTLSHERVADANSVRNTRRAYLHFLSKEWTRIEKDAEDAYRASFRLVKALLALPVRKGGIAVPGHLLEYLRRAKVPENDKAPLAGRADTKR